MALIAMASLPFSRLSLNSPPPPSSSSSSFKSLSLASSRSFSSSSSLSRGSMVASRRGFSVSDVRARPLVCFAAAAPPSKKKADSADKRARQSVKRRLYNKSRKSEIRTRMKKVFVALEDLKKQSTPSQDMLVPVETLISEAFSRIDKAVKVGTIHKNTGARRKSRLSRAKKTLEAQLGWYVPAEPSPAA